MALSRQIDEWRALRPDGVAARSVAQVVETLRLAVADICLLTRERDAARAALARFRADIEDEVSGLEAETASTAGGGHNLAITVRALGEFLDRMHTLLAIAPMR